MQTSSADTEEEMPKGLDRDGKINKLFLFTFIVNIAIPKAGIKLGGIPITLGNLMILCLIAYSLIIGNLRERKIGIPVVLYIFSICFWCIRFLAAYDGGSPLSAFIGYLIPLCVYPVAYFLVPLYLKNQGQIRRIARILYWCLLFLFCYTLLQAVFGIGRVDIPGITVNYSDYADNPGGWWLDKSNAVGDASKMVATYQNGNLFGVTIILLFPIGLSSEKSFILKGIFWALFVVSVLLCGSRTVYLGLILLIACYIVTGLARMRVKIQTLAAICVAAIAAVFGVCLLVARFAPDMADRVMSLFDAETMLQGAGRTGGALEYFAWLSQQPTAFLFGGFGMDYNGFAYEMTYICVFLLGGLVGFILFMWFLLSTVGGTIVKLPKKDPFARDFSVGILAYWIIAFIEGGYWLPPIAWNVWTIIGVARSYGAVFAKEKEKKEILRDNQVIPSTS